MVRGVTGIVTALAVFHSHDDADCRLNCVQVSFPHNLSLLVYDDCLVTIATVAVRWVRRGCPISQTVVPSPSGVLLGWGEGLAGRPLLLLEDDDRCVLVALLDELP